MIKTLFQPKQIDIILIFLLLHKNMLWVPLEVLSKGVSNKLPQYR